MRNALLWHLNSVYRSSMFTSRRYKWTSICVCAVKAPHASRHPFFKYTPSRFYNTISCLARCIARSWSPYFERKGQASTKLSLAEPAVSRDKWTKIFVVCAALLRLTSPILQVHKCLFIFFNSPCFFIIWFLMSPYITLKWLQFFNRVFFFFSFSSHLLSLFLVPDRFLEVGLKYFVERILFVFTYLQIGWVFRWIFFFFNFLLSGSYQLM